MKKRLTGTTLIEVILYIFLLGGMLLVVGGFVREMLSAKSKQGAVLEVDNDARHVLNMIEIDLKAATAVSAPASGAAGGTLTMSFTNNGSITSRTYSLSGTTVMQSTNGGAAMAISSNLVQFSNLSFSHVSTNASYHVVTISFDANYLNSGGTREKYYKNTFRSSVMLRPNL